MHQPHPSIRLGPYRPIYDWCLAVEHTRLAQAYQACKAVYPINRMPCPLLNLVVDGFIFEKPRKNVTAEKLKELLESITVDRLPRLEAHVRAVLSSLSDEWQCL